MCEFLIFNTQKRYEKQKNFGNFSATFWQLLDTFIGNFFGIHRQLVAKLVACGLHNLPSQRLNVKNARQAKNTKQDKMWIMRITKYIKNLAIKYIVILGNFLRNYFLEQKNKKNKKT